MIRCKRKITLTDEGVYLRRHGYELLNLSEKIEFGIKNYDNDIEGKVYIGAAKTSVFELIAKTIKDIRKDYPRIVFHIYSGITSDIKSRIDSGVLSFGLIFSSDYSSGYEYIDLPEKIRWASWPKKLIRSPQKTRSPSKISKTQN